MDPTAIEKILARTSREFGLERFFDIARHGTKGLTP
jgi:hypothetical protein